MEEKKWVVKLQKRLEIRGMKPEKTLLSMTGDYVAVRERQNSWECRCHQCLMRSLDSKNVCLLIRPSYSECLIQMIEHWQSGDCGESTNTIIPENLLDKSANKSTITSQTSTDGGTGSGNHGHGGRKGSVGGSAPLVTSADRKAISAYLVGKTTADGVRINKITKHAFDRVKGRKITNKTLDALLSTTVTSPGDTLQTRCYEAPGYRMVLDTVNGKLVSVMKRRQNK